MLIFDMIAILTTLLVISFGLYFLKFRKDKNRTTGILGYLYLLFGATGLVTIVIWMF